LRGGGEDVRRGVLLTTRESGEHCWILCISEVRKKPSLEYC